MTVFTKIFPVLVLVNIVGFGFICYNYITVERDIRLLAVHPDYVDHQNPAPQDVVHDEFAPRAQDYVPDRDIAPEHVRPDEHASQYQDAETDPAQLEPEGIDSNNTEPEQVDAGTDTSADVDAVADDGADNSADAADVYELTTGDVEPGVGDEPEAGDEPAVTPEEILSVSHPVGKSGYKFDDPVMAYRVLSELDTSNRFKSYYASGKKTYLGLQRDDQYCEKHRAQFVNYPEIVFEQLNVVSSWRATSFFGETVGPITTENYFKQTNKFVNGAEIKPEMNHFFTTEMLPFFFDVKKQIGCLSQEVNQVPGSGKLWLKNKVAQAAMTYVQKYSTRPECMSYDKFFPETWLLASATQCKQFFGIVNTPEHEQLLEERKIVFIKKIPMAHRGIGVKPLNKEEEDKLRATYQNGAKCGEINTSIIVQRYVHNSLLLHGHKFDFRMYMLVASTNPIIAYYNDGMLRVSLSEYDANSTDKKVLLTNLALNKKIYAEAKSGVGRTEEELRMAQQWTFDRLHAYLVETGAVTDPNWLDNYLRPEFKKAMIHLVRMTQSAFSSKSSSYYGLYGVDFMLDTDLKLWFIEANAGPSFGPYSQEMGAVIGKMLKDHFEIVHGLLKSRMKRVLNYVNQLVSEGVAYENDSGELVINDLAERKAVFNKISKNYFEPEFEPSAENGFSKIVDNNEEGVNRYQGYIDAGCL